MKTWTMIAVLLGGLGALAQAAPVALDITNPGFDDDVLAPGGYTTGGCAGWTQFQGLTGCQYAGAGLPALSGNNVAFLSNHQVGYSGMYQTLKVDGSALSVVEGGVIDLSLYQGHRSDYQPGVTQEFSIQLWRDEIGGSGTKIYDTGTLGSVADGTWVERQISYTATASDVGKDILLLLWSNTASQVCLEDVSGTYDVPEPATMSLLALGGLGVLIRRRKR
ncbi:MAG: PEP-CTERM sorting domain-containing protein [Phycisphaerae bacterium]|nr:PEP-CTERM sorting domain-containing protein [Phycisphaerae bacterium]